MSVAAAPYSTRRAAQSAISPEQHTNHPILRPAQPRDQARLMPSHRESSAPRIMMFYIFLALRQRGGAFQIS